MPKGRLQFIHIPKCAGMTLNSAFESYFGAEHAAFFFGKDEDRALWQVRWQENHWEHEASFLDFKQTILQSLLNGPARFVGGHLPFSPLAHNYHKESTAFITLLRDPLPRSISALTYLVMNHGAYPSDAYNAGEQDPVAELQAWMADDDFTAVVCNQMSIYLGGLNYQCRPELKKRLEHAKAALSLLDLFGFVEEMDAFLDQVRGKLGIQLTVESRNRKTDYIIAPELDQRIADFFDSSRRQLLLRHCCVDQELYDFARELSEKH